jgi:hypothetical protein
MLEKNETEEVVKKEFFPTDVFVKVKYGENCDPVYLKIKKINVYYKYSLTHHKLEIDFIDGKKAILQDFKTREIEHII